MNQTTRLIAVLVVCLTLNILPAPAMEVNIDASKTGEPITKLIYGGLVESASIQAWAEMLYDRKFFYAVELWLEPVREGPRSPGMPDTWRPVGPAEFVVMDREYSYVGEHTPLIKLDGSTPHGIRQAGLALRKGKSYTGRIILAGDSGASIKVSLVWGVNPGDRQTIKISPFPGSYAKFPLKFTSKADTNDGRLKIVGTGNGEFYIGAVSLMPADNVQGFNPDTIKYLKELGITIARWPGGNYVSGYDWQYGIGDIDKRPPVSDVVRGGLEMNDNGIDEFIIFCRLIDAEPYIVVNSGFGDVRSAAEEVEYCNGSIDTAMGKLRASGGHPEPYNVKLWGIGNEMYGPWQMGHMQLKHYCLKHSLFTRAMKKIDPTIKVVASGATVEELGWCSMTLRQFEGWKMPLTMSVPYKIGSGDDWSYGLLASIPDDIDYLGEHFHAYLDMAFDKKTQRFYDVKDPLELCVRRLPNKLAFKFEAWPEYLKRIPSLKEKNIKFAFDQWSPGNRTVAGGLRTEARGMKSPMAVALTYHEMFRHTDMIYMAAYADAFGKLLFDNTGSAVGYRVEGLIFKTFREHLCEIIPVAVSGDSPQPQIEGTVGLDRASKPSGSDAFPLDVVAGVSTDRKTFTLSVINPTESAQNFNLNVTGLKLSGTGKLWQIAADNVNASNAEGEKPEVDIVETPVKKIPKEFVVAPISINVYEFEAGQ